MMKEILREIYSSEETVNRNINLIEKLSLEKLDNVFVYTIVATMLGARLGHVFFYDWKYYKNHLIEILLPKDVILPGIYFVRVSALDDYRIAKLIVNQ